MYGVHTPIIARKCYGPVPYTYVTFDLILMSTREKVRRDISKSQRTTLIERGQIHSKTKSSFHILEYYTKIDFLTFCNEIS